jgi:hypothetical protein
MSNETNQNNLHQDLVNTESNSESTAQENEAVDEDFQPERYNEHGYKVRINNSTFGNVNSQ